MRAFCAWLVRRAAPHVRRLHMAFCLEPAEQRGDVLLSAVACGLACCAAGGLDELSLHLCYGDLQLGWAAALTPLRRLAIDTCNGCGIDIAQQLDHLTHMRELFLSERLPC